MKPSDEVRIKNTPQTRSFGIAGGPGIVERVGGETVYVIYTDPLFGPAGPFELPLSSVEPKDSAAGGEAG